MTKSLTNNPDALSQQDVRDVLSAIQAQLVDVCLTDPGLAIGTSNATDIKLANSTHILQDGELKELGVQEVAISGDDVTNGNYDVFVVYVDSTGSLATAQGTQASSLAGVEFPSIPEDAVVVGFIIVNPTGTGDFDPGTTDLDDATVTPNTVYVDTDYPFNPDNLSL